jgi:hypothetical protein
MRRPGIAVLVCTLSALALAANASPTFARLSDEPVMLSRCPVVSLEAVKRWYPAAAPWTTDSAFSRYAGTALVPGVTVTDCDFRRRPSVPPAEDELLHVSAFCASASARAKLWQGRALALRTLLKLRPVKIGDGGYLEFHTAREQQATVLRFRSRYAYLEAALSPTYTRKDLGPFFAVARVATHYRC